MKKSLQTSLMMINEDDFDVFLPNDNDDDEMLQIKNNFWLKLEKYEQNLFVIYVLCDSNINKIAQNFNISWSTTQKYINNIKSKILC